MKVATCELHLTVRRVAVTDMNPDIWTINNSFELWFSMLLGLFFVELYMFSLCQDLLFNTYDLPETHRHVKCV